MEQADFNAAIILHGEIVKHQRDKNDIERMISSLASVEGLSTVMGHNPKTNGSVKFLLDKTEMNVFLNNRLTVVSNKLTQAQSDFEAL